MSCTRDKHNRPESIRYYTHTLCRSGLLCGGVRSHSVQMVLHIVRALNERGTYGDAQGMQCDIVIGGLCALGGVDVDCGHNNRRRILK